MTEGVSKTMKTVVESFHSWEPSQQEPQLQTILKAAMGYKDGRIELEFKG
jgi:hypothetical protein